MTVFRKDEKPTLGRRAAEAAMALASLALVVGLVGALVVGGMSLLHSSLDRNQDPNLEAAVAPPTAPVAAPPTPSPKPPPRPVPAPSAEAIAVKAAVPPPSAPPSAPPKAPAVPRDPSRLDEEGFIRYWLLLAPIPLMKEHAGAADVAAERIPGEASMRPRSEERVKVAGQDYVWKRYRSPEFLVDFKKYVEGGRSEQVLAYAVCYLVSPVERRDVRLFVGSNDQCRVYLNGQSVLLQEKSRTLLKDQDAVPGLTLLRGKNVVVLKVANQGGNWQGCLRFGDASGAPILDLQVSSTPP